MFMGPRNWFQGINSSSLWSPAGRYHNPVPTQFLAPIDCLKIPAQVSLPRNGSERNSDSSFYICSTEWNSELFSLPLKGLKGNSESILLFLFPWNRIPSCFSSAEVLGWKFQEFASISVKRNGIPSCFLFRGRVRNGILRGFCSAEQPEFRRK